MFVCLFGMGAGCASGVLVFVSKGEGIFVFFFLVHAPSRSLHMSVCYEEAIVAWDVFLFSFCIVVVVVVVGEECWVVS